MIYMRIIAIKWLTCSNTLHDVVIHNVILWTIITSTLNDDSLKADAVKLVCSDVENVEKKLIWETLRLL